MVTSWYASVICVNLGDAMRTLGSAGCESVTLRAHGINLASQPVVSSEHLCPAIGGSEMATVEQDIQKLELTACQLDGRACPSDLSGDQIHVKVACRQTQRIGCTAAPLHCEDWEIPATLVSAFRDRFAE